MSLIINTNKISDEVKKIDKNKKIFNDINNDIFFELSKLDSYWIGKTADYFNDKITKEKNNILIVLNNIEELSNFYKRVENNYKKYDIDGK